jgi:hypothetical protein
MSCCLGGEIRIFDIDKTEEDVIRMLKELREYLDKEQDAHVIGFYHDGPVDGIHLCVVIRHTFGGKKNISIMPCCKALRAGRRLCRCLPSVNLKMITKINPGNGAHVMQIGSAMNYRKLLIYECKRTGTLRQKLVRILCDNHRFCCHGRVDADYEPTILVECGEGLHRCLCDRNHKRERLYEVAGE